MKRKLLITTAVVAALGIGAVALGTAVAGGWREGGYGPCGGYSEYGGPGMMKGKGGPDAVMFNRFDADGDGTVTRAEFDAGHTDMLKAADKDGDGAVSLDEFNAFADDMRNEMRAQHRAQRQAWVFSKLDANDDGTVTADEIAPHAEDRFEAFDRNDDGAVSAEELQKSMRGHRGGWHRGPHGPKWDDD